MTHFTDYLVNQDLLSERKMENASLLTLNFFEDSGNVRQGTMTVYVLGQNAAGEFLHHWDKTYDLRFTDNQFAELLNRGLQFHQDMQLRPDVTTLRVLVQDPATGTLGSLIIPLAQVH